MIGRVRESRNPKKVIRVALMESYGEIRRVPVNLLRVYYAISRAYEVWLYKFENFERFCNQFSFNKSFVDEKFYVKKMANWFPLLPDSYVEYVDNICSAVQKRNFAILEKQ